MSKRDADRLMRLFKALLDKYGPQHWWPGETDWEVMVGAILTQNTAWTNVEKALGNLKEKDLLTIEGLHSVTIAELAELIRPSGYFTAFIVEKHQGRLEHLFSQDTAALREELLSQKGIGPETADAIMLYAGDHLTFVIDAYTLRFAKRYTLPFESIYGPARDYFQQNLPMDLYIYQELHALIDNHAKVSCRPKPDCEGCFLRRSCKRKGL